MILTRWSGSSWKGYTFPTILEREVNSGDCLPGRGASSYISSAVNLPSGGGVVLVFTKSVG